MGITVYAKISNTPGGEPGVQRRALDATSSASAASPPQSRRPVTPRPPTSTSIPTIQPSAIGFLAVERKVDRDVIGYCGLVDSARGSAAVPQLAFSLLRRVWRQGYATEASLAVPAWARSSGYAR